MKNALPALLGMLLAAHAGLSQEPQRIGLKAGVETVAAEIEVLVTDAKGEPVLDLTKDDFRLFVDGQPMAVDWVEAPRATPEAAAHAPDAAGAPDSAPAPEAAPQPPPAVRRPPHSTVILVDEWHLDFASRHDGLLALEAAVKRLPDEEEVALYAFRVGVHRVLPFTHDHAAVLAALRKVGTSAPVKEYAKDLGGTRQLLRSVSWILHTLASRPEPKTVLLIAGSVSDGPVEPAAAPAAVAPLPPELNSQSELADSRGATAFGPAALYQYDGSRAADEAMLARATVVALDPTGLRADDADAASRSPSTPAPNAWGYRTDALALVAERTGGARLGFTNDSARALTNETALLARRYRIGFTPRDNGGARRDVRVEVSRSGLVVRAPAGQRTATADSAGTARFASILIESDKPAADFAIKVVRHEAPKLRGRLREFKFELLLPLRELLFQEQDGRLIAAVEFEFAAVDPNGRTSTLQRNAVRLRLPERDEAARSGIFRYPANLFFPSKGPVRLLFGVRDRSTGRLGVGSVDEKI